MKKVFLVIILSIMLLVFSSTIIGSVTNKEITTDFERVVQNNFLADSAIKEIYGATSLFLSPNYLSSGAFNNIKDDDGYLELSSESHEFDTYTPALNMANLQSMCENEGIFFSYVSFPSKYSRIDTKKLYGFDTDIYDYRSELLNGLYANNVNVLDVLELLGDSFDEKEFFYKTDHHEKTESGLLMSKYIVEYLNTKANAGMNIDLINENNLTINTIKECWLGEEGKGVTKTWVGALDDYSLIMPNYKTNFNYKVPKENYEVEGDFDILINHNIYDRAGDIYDISMHYSYLPYAESATPPTIYIDNKDISGKKILLIKDSFSVAVAPFLALCAKELVLWDMRGMEDGDSLYSFIDQNDFDIVMVAYSDYWDGVMYDFR